ncbi:hypothetical protein J437_LFUL017959, partial [Ladona fulva]
MEGNIPSSFQNDHEDEEIENTDAVSLPSILNEEGSSLQKLTRARRFVERTFGIMSNKWRTLHRPLDVKTELASAVVKTCCILHNFVRERDGYEFEDTLTCCLDSLPNPGLRGTQTG